MIFSAESEEWGLDKSARKTWRMTQNLCARHILITKHLDLI